MLTKFELKNFKCFQELELPCASLNLLCGLNGTGKSSVIQTLLVLRQSLESRELSANGRLDLSGGRVDLGSGTDVIHDGDVEPVVSFVLHSNEHNEPAELVFEHMTPEASRDPSRPYMEIWGVNSSNVFDDGLYADGLYESIDAYTVGWPSELIPTYTRLLYAPAERVGPQKNYPHSITRATRGDLGPKAEYAWSYLAHHQREPMAAGDPRVRQADQRLLIDVVDQWLQDISPGAHIDLEVIEKADLIVPAFAFDQPLDVATRPYRATNVGFGLSYTLPVLLALLAPPGTLALIENPEAHLHPRGQTQLGELAARAAMAGVQVFVETHSDHFMDGVRIAVKEGLIAPEDVRFNYFSRQGNVATATTPKVDDQGRLSEWPEGFFDQNALNLARLLAPRTADA